MSPTENWVDEWLEIKKKVEARKPSDEEWQAEFDLYQKGLNDEEDNGC